MSTTTNLTTLKINYLTQSQYNIARATDQINEDEIYLTPSTPLEDYVTLQGTTGSWTYRRWNSGLQECWYHGSVTFTTAGASYQGWYRSVETISLPTATGFTAFADTAAVIGNGAHNAHIFTAAGLVKTNGTEIEVQLLGGSAVAADTTATACNIYVCGFARS